METCTLSTENPQDTVIPMEQQESVLILLKHCQEMKRQESRLRLLTFSLILSFASVFFFTQLVIRDSIEKATFKPAEYSRQQAKDEYQEQSLMFQNQRKPSIHLTTPDSNCSAITKYIQWQHKHHYGLVHLQGFVYDKANSSLVVPQDGQYFVYVGMNFRNILEELQILSLKVEKYSVCYKEFVEVLVVKDTIPASTQISVNRRTVYTGQVLSLMEGDLLRVWLDENNYKLIDCTSEKTMYFGAFLL